MTDISRADGKSWQTSTGVAKHGPAWKSTTGTFSGRILPNLKLRRVEIPQADFQGAVARDALLSECCLTRAEFGTSDWSGSVLRMCRLDNVRARDARFIGARIEDCSVVRGDLSGADLTRTQLTDSAFSRSDLSRVDLTGASGDSVEFDGADLREARLADVDLPDADFRGADLRGADFTGARLKGADFRGARLDRATFEGADLARARFDAETARQPSTLEDLIVRIEEQDLAGRLGQATGFQAEVQSRLRAALEEAEGFDPATLAGEAFSLLRACDSSDAGAGPQERLGAALASAPQISRLLAAADLDPAQLASFFDGSESSDGLPAAIGPFLGPLAEALGLDAGAGPQAVIDALTGRRNGSDDEVRP